jgi:protein phosphatase
VTANPVTSGDIFVHVFGRTDVGRTREHNEDAFMVADLTSGSAMLEPALWEHAVGGRGSLFMVADGLGGAASGELASGMAIDVVLEQMRERWASGASSDPTSFAAALKGAAETANTRIHAYALEHPEHRGMGTTATIVGVLGDTLYVVQVGDSRAYLVRSGVAQQITKDQSLMQRLVEAGELTEAEAEQSERRNIILQALGPEPVVRIDLTHQRLRRGDTLVLCTDGLFGVVRKEEIAAVVSEEPDLAAACDRLIDMANANGGPDNITVVVARFDGDGLKRASAEDTVGHTVYSIPGAAPWSGGPLPQRRIRRSTGAARRPAEAPAPEPVERPLPYLLRGNTPYVVAIVLTVLIAAFFFARRMNNTREPGPPRPAAADSTQPAPAPVRTP